MPDLVTMLTIAPELPPHLEPVNLIYSDAPLALSTDFAIVAAYIRELKRAATEALSEEAVLVSVEQIYHAV